MDYASEGKRIGIQKIQNAHFHDIEYTFQDIEYTILLIMHHKIKNKFELSNILQAILV